ncbi:phage tail fiber C-terminal domain-containing protein, partial [Escherichia coli]|uniref:phage tail fiber C-terminal domain-containing protein n=1 Tax=Escherichia coli TaxID=562 RepID=UPI0014857908
HTGSGFFSAFAGQVSTRVQGFFQHLQVRFGDGPWQDVKGLDEVGSDTGRTGE